MSTNKRTQRRRRNGRNALKGVTMGNLGTSGLVFTPAVQRGPTPSATQLSHMPLPRVPHFQTGMVYYENGLSITGTTGAIGNYFFRANDAFDPNQTGTGHQPMGFDQMMLLFEQFYVLRSNIKVRFVNTGTNVAVVGVALTPDTTSIVPESSQEQGLLKSRLIMKAGNAGDHQTVNLACECPMYFGIKRQPYIASSLYQGTAGNVPTELCYFKLFTYSVDGSTTAAVNFDVTLTYDVYFQEPRQLGESVDLPLVLKEAFLKRKLLRIRKVGDLTHLQDLKRRLASIELKAPTS
jgi:hypothetical protein